MRILFNVNTLKHNKIIKELNAYWQTLDYPQCRMGKKKKAMLYCDRYSFWVDRYSVTISDHYMNLTEKEQEEILTMLNMVFKDNIKGYLDNYEGHDSKELISIIEKNKNVVKIKHTTPCRYNKKKVSDCKALVDTIPETEENKETLQVLKNILDDVYKNTYGKEE